MRALPFSAAALPAIAEELGVPARLAPYRPRGEAVYELELECAALPGARLLVVLWFSLQRVDVRLLPAVGGPPVMALTRKEIESVELYPGVEVMFRRAGGRGVLFVTRTGVAALAD